MCICLTVYLVYSLKFKLWIGWFGFNTKHATSLFNAYDKHVDHRTSCITRRRSMIAHWTFPEMENEFCEFNDFEESDKSLKHELESV